MLLSDQPAGSLRSEPVIISRADQRRDNQLPEAEFPDYLVLSQAAGLDSMKLRVFQLPIKTGVGKPAMLGPEPEVPGWSWFPPFQNCERIVQVTDEGVIGLIGINQFRNHDKDLFLEMKYQIPPGKADERKGRAQVVHVSEDDVWVLARGGLRLWHFDRFGPNLLPLWQQPLNLGSPLHAAQVDEGRVLVLATQSSAEPICKITAVSPAADRDVGEIRWQKQLGLLCRGEPVIIGGQVLLLDQGGGLFQFDPKDHAAANGWEAAGKRVAPPLVSAARGPYLLPSEDGKALDIVALSPLGRLVVSRHEPGKTLERRSYASFKSLPSSPPARRQGPWCWRLEERHVGASARRRARGRATRAPMARAARRPRRARLRGGHRRRRGLSTDGSRGLTRGTAGAGGASRRRLRPRTCRRGSWRALVLPRGRMAAFSSAPADAERHAVGVARHAGRWQDQKWARDQVGVEGHHGGPLLAWRARRLHPRPPPARLDRPPR